MSSLKRRKKKPFVRLGGRIFTLPLFHWLRGLVLWAVALFMRLWWSTLKMEIEAEGQENLEYIMQLQKPMLVVFWHNHLFIAPYWLHLRQKKGICALVSAGALGAWVSQLYGMFGVEALRGSKNLRGKEVLYSLVKALERGRDVVVTPDGSRGPCYSFKGGAAYAAQKTNCAIVLLACRFSSAWRCKTWDRFYLPKPFSKVVMRYLYAENVGALVGSENVDNLPFIQETMRSKLRSITEE